MSNQRLSLQELENSYWPDSKEYPTELVKRCHDLRKVALEDLDLDDIRFLLVQNIGAKYLIPLAVVELKSTILAEGMYYPGDLLMSVLKVSPEFWRNNQNQWKEVYTLVAKAKVEIENSEEINKEIKSNILNAYDSFSRLVDNH